MRLGVNIFCYKFDLAVKLVVGSGAARSCSVDGWRQGSEVRRKGMVAIGLHVEHDS